MRRVAKAFLIVSLAGLAVMLPGAQARGPALAPRDLPAVHIQHAQRLVQDIDPRTDGAPDEVNPEALPGTWQATALPHDEPRRLAWPPGSGTAADGDPDAGSRLSWYRVRLPDLGAHPRPHQLYLPSWKGNSQIAVYVDGRLRHQSQTNLRWNGSSRPLWLPLGEATEQPPARELLVRLRHERDHGGALSTLWVGGSQALALRFALREWLQADLPAQGSAAFLALGLFSLAVWQRQRREPLYLLFFATSVAGYGRTLYYHVGQNRLVVPEAWFGWLTVSAMAWLLTSVHLSQERMHGRRTPWLTALLLGATAVITLSSLPLLPFAVEATQIAPWAALVVLVLGNASQAWHLWLAWRTGARDAAWLAGWGLLCMQLGAYDWMLHNNRVSVEGIYLSSYFNVGVFGIFTYIMYRRYVSAMEQTQRANSDLTLHLRRREAELLESHRRLREVEQQELLRLERSRMMQDMHDGLGSSLVSALRVTERAGISADEVAQVLRSCLDDLKLTIDSLEPIDADLLLLLATLRFRLGPRLESSGMVLRWEIEDVPAMDWLTPRNALHILRILQEAFTNVLKHTRATEIRVSTATREGGVEVCVVDNGQGFDPDAALRSRSMGLTNQRRRADAIGARVRLDSGAHGTRFVLWLPLTQS